MQSQENNPSILNPQKIISAFDIIINASNSKQLIKEADTYIHQCENNPQFGLTLMQIFSQVNNQQTQWQALIHLNNVIKRNWTTKRRTHEVCCLTQQMKNNIKNGLVDLYKIYWRTYYKEFNEMFKFLAKFEFPSNYPALKKFIIEILSTLANSDIQVLMSPPQLLPYLSLVKTVFKQNSMRRYLHTKQIYLQHIAQPVQLSLSIFTKINNALNKIRGMKESIDSEMGNKLLQCSRKIDKIILYCLQCAVTTMQTDPTICQIVQYMISKIQLLQSIPIPSFRQQIQLNILAILEGVSRIQANLPFVFTNFLTKYLQLIINLLLNQNFKNQKLIQCLIIANNKPLVTFAYYTSESQFKQSIECRKGLSSSYFNEQYKCHQQFLTMYGGNNTLAFLQKAINELMNKYPKENLQSQIMFEDTESYQSTNQCSPFQLLMILLRNLISRFKEEIKGFFGQLFDHLLQNQIISTSSNEAMNMYEIVLLLPKVYDQVQINLDKVFELMELAYMNQDYIMFSRLIRSYNAYFTMTKIYKSFEILVTLIANPSVKHQIVYQCAVCIKKILSEHQEDELPLENLGMCLANLLSLVVIYKTIPTHLWNLLQLITEILKLVSNQVLMNNLNYVIQNTQVLIDFKDNDELIISAISDLLQNVLEIIPPEQANNQEMLQYLYEISIKLVGMHVYNTKLENPQILYKLWLSVLRNAQIPRCSTNLTSKLVNAFYTLKDKLLKQDQILFLELIEQYVIKNLITLNPENVISIVEEIQARTELEKKNRVLMAIFSFYFSYFLMSGTYIPKMLVKATQVIRNLCKLSQQNNILRTFIMLVINHHIIVIGPQKIFEILTQNFNSNYQEWFWPYLWSLEYLNHKYACKVASIALLSSLQVLQRAQILLPQIQQCVPLEKIMKLVSFQVQPISLLSAITSYINAFKMMIQPDQKKARAKIGYAATKLTPLKFKLHIKAEWAECDLTEMYRQKFTPFITQLGWTLQTIDHKFDKLIANNIIALLSGKSNDDSNQQ